jgi:hypothetical protein
MLTTEANPVPNLETNPNQVPDLDATPPDYSNVIKEPNITPTGIFSNHFFLIVTSHDFFVF